MLLEYSGVKKGRHGGLKSLQLPAALKELIIFSPCLNVHPPSLHSTAGEPAAGNQVDGQAHIIYWKISIHKICFALQGMRVKKRKRQALMSWTDYAKLNKILVDKTH